MEFLADGYNIPESTGAGSVQLRLFTGDAMPLVRSYVHGNGISYDMSLEDVRGDGNLSLKDDILSDLAFLGWNIFQMGIAHLRVPVQVLCNCCWL